MNTRSRTNPSVFSASRKSSRRTFYEADCVIFDTVAEPYVPREFHCEKPTRFEEREACLPLIPDSERPLYDHLQETYNEILPDLERD